MKRLFLLIAGLVIIVFIILQNDPPTSDPTITGYIVEADFGSILVVSGITKEQASSLSSKEMLDFVDGVEGKDAIVFYKYNFFRFKEGQQVKVWAEGGIAESFPAQADAAYIEVLNE